MTARPSFAGQCGPRGEKLGLARKAGISPAQFPQNPFGLSENFLAEKLGEDGAEMVAAVLWIVAMVVVCGLAVWNAG